MTTPSHFISTTLNTKLNTDTNNHSISQNGFPHPSLMSHHSTPKTVTVMDNLYKKLDSSKQNVHLPQKNLDSNFILALDKSTSNVTSTTQGTESNLKTTSPLFPQNSSTNSSNISSPILSLHHNISHHHHHHHHQQQQTHLHSYQNRVGSSPLVGTSSTSLPSSTTSYRSGWSNANIKKQTINLSNEGKKDAITTPSSTSTTDESIPSLSVSDRIKALKSASTNSSSLPLNHLPSLDRSLSNLELNTSLNTSKSIPLPIPQNPSFTLAQANAVAAAKAVALAQLQKQFQDKKSSSYISKTSSSIMKSTGDVNDSQRSKITSTPNILESHLLEKQLHQQVIPINSVRDRLSWFQKQSSIDAAVSKKPTESTNDKAKLSSRSEEVSI